MSYLLNNNIIHLLIVNYYSHFIDEETEACTG